MKPLVLGALLAGMLALPGCGDDDPPAPAGDFQRLIGSDWTAQPGEEGYRCARLTLEEDVYVVGMRAIAPVGSHHSGLQIGDPVGPDGDEPCAGDPPLDPMLFAAGIGTDDLELPEGAGIRIPAGQQLKLDVHYFNPTDEPLTGTTAVDARIVPASEVEREVRFTFAGPVEFALPPTTGRQDVRGTCTLPDDVTILSWFPHTHALGVHMKVVYNGEVIHDEPFDHQHQWLYPDLRQARAGDVIDVTCTYVNGTGETVVAGPSSTDEMCFVGLYTTPALPGSLCLDGFGP